MAEFASLKVGDKVAVDVGWRDMALRTIDGETTKYWIVGNAKYRKDNGKMMGSAGWNTSSLHLLTSDILSQVDLTRRKNLWAAIQKATFPEHLTLNELQAIHASVIK